MDRTKKEEGKSIFRIPPYYYIHVLDQNTNVTKMEVGPKTYIRQDNEKVILGPEKMIVVPPRHYCIVENPVARDKDCRPLIDEHGQVSRLQRLQHSIFKIDISETVSCNKIPVLLHE